MSQSHGFGKISLPAYSAHGVLVFLRLYQKFLVVRDGELLHLRHEVQRMRGLSVSDRPRVGEDTCWEGFALVDVHRLAGLHSC